MAKIKTKQQLTIENQELRVRLQELEDTLDAIRSGAVDAIVTSGPAGDRVYTLEGADHAYHTMVESMNEGAVTILTDGTILYGNNQFGQMTGSSPSGFIGRRFHEFVPGSDYPVLNAILDKEGHDCPKTEMRLRNAPGAEIPVQIAASPIELNGAKALTLVITDLSSQRRYEEIVAAERLSRYILEQSLEGIAVCVNGRILFASRRLHEIYGNNPLLQPFDRLFPLRISESETFSVEAPQSGKVVKALEVSYQNPAGENYFMILNAGPLYGDDHRILGTLISLTDITERKQAEEEIARLYRDLQQRIQELEAVFQTVPIGLAIAEDPEGRHIRGNPANEQMLGLLPGAELSRRQESGPAPYRALHDGRELSVDELPMQQAVRGERVSGLIMDVMRQDGRTVKLYSNASPLLDEQGRPRGAVGAFLDITELSRSQEALKESEERYRQLVNTAPDAIVVHRDGCCLFANAAALRLYGVDDFEQLKSCNIVDLLHPDDRADTLSRIERVQSGERTALREARLLRLDGQEVIVEAMAAPIHYGGNRAVQVILRDISLRKQSEEALRESERQLRQANDLLEAVTKGTNVIIAAMDKDFRYTFFNRAYADEIGRLTGRDIQVGSTLEELFEGMPEQLETASREWSRPLAGETVSKTIEFGAPGLRRRFYSTLRTPLRDAAGRVVGAGEAAIDITEQVQAEEALRRNEARFRLLSETSARLLAAEDPQGVIDSLCRQVMEHLDCQAFFNFMVDERAGRLRLNACAGIPGEEIRKLEWLDYGVAVCGCVARDEVRIIAEDIFHTPDVRTELVKSYGIQAYCCHPLKAQDRLIGTLSFGTKTRSRFTADEVELMRTVADQVAVAMQRLQARQEVLDANQRLQMALDSGGMGTWAWDLRANRITWNQRQYELLGLPPGGGLEDPEAFLALVHPEDAQDLRKSLLDALAKDSLAHWEFRIVRPDGQVRWLSSTGHVTRDETGQPISMVGVNYDFTARKKREEDLAKLNRILRALSSSSHALTRFEEEKAYLEEVCRIVARDCGYTMVWIGYAEDDEARTVRPMAHAGFEDGYLETLNLTWADTERGRGPTGTAIRTGNPVICADMLTDPRFAPWRDEALRRGYASSLALPLMDEGAAFGAITIYSKLSNPFDQAEVILLGELVEDLTRGIMMLRLRRQNRQAQQALRESEEQFRGVFAQSSSGIVITDFDGRILEVNPSFCGMLGYTERELAGLNVLDLTHPEDREAEAAKAAEMKEGRLEGFRLEKRYLGKDGKAVWAEIGVNALHDDKGNMLYALGMAEDISERKAAEEALRRSKEELEEKVHERTAELILLLEDLEKSRNDLRKLASELVMSEEKERKRIAVTLHDEVAQSLAAAKMRLDLLRSTTDGDESRQLIDDARELLMKSIRETRTLMTDISSPILYDMGLPAAVQNLAEQASASYGLTISHSVSGAFENLEQETGVMIYQAVRELLHNVVKHSQARNASIRIIADGSAIRTIVADDGQGFDMDDIGLPGHEGGFGLFSIRERVKSFNGSMLIESAPGKGTSVTVVLPTMPNQEKEAGTEEKPRQKSGRRRKS